MSFRSLTILAYIATILSMVHGAFVPLHSSSCIKEQTSTLYLFGNGPKKTDKPDEVQQPIQKANSPFIFLFGKPQYDWVTGKEMDENSWVSKKRVNNWGTGYTKSKKSQDEETSKKGKK
jgi:hypothetical protein